MTININKPVVELRSPDSLTPYTGNPKSHPSKQIDAIASSISEYGFSVPLVVNTEGVVLSGHGRLEAARRLGLDKVPVIVKDDLTPAQQKGFRLADNRVAQSDWLDEALAQELKELEELGFDLEQTGFDSDEIDELLGVSHDAGEGGGDEDDVPDVDEVEPREGLVLGSIWQLGRHRICCGDSTDEAQVKRLLGDAIVNMVFSDPPYGINIVASNVTVGGGEAYDIPFGGVKNRKGYVGGGGNCNRTPIAVSQERKAKKELGLGSIGGSKPFGSKDVRGSIGASNIVKVNKYYPIEGDDSTDTAIAAYQVGVELCPDAVQVWWGGNYYAHALPPSSCWLVWDKENTGNFADAELAWTNQPTAVRIFKHMWNGMLKASEHGEKRVHPTQKPQALFSWVASKYGQDGDITFDPFLGSGMSLLAAQKMDGDHTVYGCELSQIYCEIVMQRYFLLTGIEPQLIQH